MGGIVSGETKCVGERKIVGGGRGGREVGGRVSGEGGRVSREAKGK